MNVPDSATISAAHAKARAAAGDDDAILTDLLPWAASFASAPVSGFTVGAVVRGRSGALYAGTNFEFARLPLSASVHAEQAALANASLHGERGVDLLAVSASPCGHCRQFLNELDNASRLRILIPEKAPATLAELLPASFGPSDLGITGRLLDTDHHALTAAVSDDLAAAALAAANASYAPYTRTYAGVALRLRDGTLATGRYAECAAYNPSLPAFQAALVDLGLRRAGFDTIADAVLVEAAGVTSQRSAAAAALDALAGIPLRYLTAVAREDR